MTNEPKISIRNVYKIFGADPPDGGEIRIRGKPAEFGTPAEAIRNGIGYCSEDRKPCRCSQPLV